MARVTEVKKARKDQGSCPRCSREIKAGEPYRWWKFRFGGKHVRCMDCRIKPSELTQSEYLGQTMEFQERIEDLSWELNSLTELIEELKGVGDEIRDLGEEQSEKLDNMPEGLQEGDAGQLLQERADACEEASERVLEAAEEIEALEGEERTEDAVEALVEDAISALGDTII